jgi:hypothetical protein
MDQLAGLAEEARKLALIVSACNREPVTGVSAVLQLFIRVQMDPALGPVAFALANVV